jgi:hypothetical protein
VLFHPQDTKKKGIAMKPNALAAWNWLPPVVRKSWRRRQLGFVVYEAGRRPGVEPRVANAHARFEYEARQALRDWLLL